VLESTPDRERPISEAERSNIRETAGTTRSSRRARRPSSALTAVGELALPIRMAIACAQKGSVVMMSIAPVPLRR